MESDVWEYFALWFKVTKPLPKKNLLHPNFQMFHFTQTKQTSHCWGSKSKQLLFFRLDVGKGLDTIMSLCLQGFTYSAAFPAPPKDPMDLSKEEDALVFRSEPKQRNEARPHHFCNQNFETQVSWDLLDWQVASSPGSWMSRQMLLEPY